MVNKTTNSELSNNILYSTFVTKNFTSFNSFSARNDFGHLLITYANSLGSGFGSEPFYSLKVFLKEFSEKVVFEFFSRRQQNHENYPACKELRLPPHAWIQKVLSEGVQI